MGLRRRVFFVHDSNDLRWLADSNIGRSAIKADSERQYGVTLDALPGLNGRAERVSLGGAYDGFFNAVPDFGNGLFLGAVLVQEVALHDAGVNNASADVDQDFDHDLGADIATVCLARILRRGNTNG